MVLVAGMVAGAVLAFGFIRGSADTMVSYAPSDTAVYANLDLAPSGAQQLDLNGLLGQFPGLSGASRDATINQWLDSALSPAGLSHTDIRSWLGSQLSLLVLKSDGATPAEVALLSCTNQVAAQSMFNKFKSGPLGTVQRWTSASYDGVTIHVGEDSSGDESVWAITPDTVVIGTTEGAVDEVIDTSQGKHDRLTSAPDYTAVQARVPSDRIAFLYLDVPALRALVPSADAAAFASALSGYQGIGEAVVATSSGLTVTGTVDFDRSKLSAAARASLGVAAHANGALAFVPERAFGFIAVVGLPQMLKSLTSLAGSGLGASGSEALQQLGITGPGGVLSHLTGDAGIEVEQVPGAQVPSGSLLLATDGSAGVQGFLDRLAETVCSAESSACGSPSPTHTTYRGVTVSSITITGVDAAQLSPSWAVDNGWAIIASTPAEVRAVIDAKQGDNITTSPAYRTVAGKVGTSNDGMVYLNVHSLVAAIRAVLPPDVQQAFDDQVAPYLAPVQAIGSSNTAFSDHIATTEFILIG